MLPAPRTRAPRRRPRRVVLLRAADGTLMIPPYAGALLPLRPHPRASGAVRNERRAGEDQADPAARKVTAKPAASARGASVAPLPKPVVRTRKPAVRVEEAGRPREARSPARPPARRAPRRAPPRRAARGRRRPAGRAGPLACSRAAAGVGTCHPRSATAAVAPPPLPVAPAVPDPTPLGLVALGEALPSEGDEWPAWVFSLLGVLAASEVFLLVHLARARAFAEA